MQAKKLIKFVALTLILVSGLSFLKPFYYYTKAELAQHLLSNAWLKTQLAKGLRTFKPWPWADTYPILKLDLPSLKESYFVLNSSSGQSLAFGPGLHTTNLLPGETGNSVIAGHRDTHFKSITQLKIGDKLIVENNNGKLITFIIDRLTIANAETDFIQIDQTQSRLSLVTCLPPQQGELHSPLRHLISAIRLPTLY